MIEAAAACITGEESRRPGILEIIAILKGEEKAPLPSRSKRYSFLGHGCVTDCYSQFQNTNSEMTGHLALAMSGLPEFEDDDYLFCR